MVTQQEIINLSIQDLMKYPISTIRLLRNKYGGDNLKEIAGNILEDYGMMMKEKMRMNDYRIEDYLCEIDANVKILDLSNKNLEYIPDLRRFRRIYNLYLANNRIDKIENIPKTIFSLDLSENRIHKIENLPTNLLELFIRNNKIEKIEGIPSKITRLDLANNRITKIENIPNSVKLLSISDNNIYEISGIPSTVEYLDLSNNQITNVRNIPNFVEFLKLNGNQIKRIDALPEFLEKLEIKDNPVVYISENILKRYADGELEIIGDDSVKDILKNYMFAYRVKRRKL